MMKHKTLNSRLLVAFFAVIGILGACMLIMGYYSVQIDILDRAQKQVQKDLCAARAVFQNELEEMETSFGMFSFPEKPSALKNHMGLDYLYIVETRDKGNHSSPIVQKAFQGNPNGGTRWMDSLEVSKMGEDLRSKASIIIQNTPKARPATRSVLSDALVLEYATPVLGPSGEVLRAVYGGKMLNRSFSLIAKMHDIVYENRLYKSKPVGTVTIFQDDVRIATNVLDQEGRPAIGTRISETVYDKVVGQGIPWFSRAFVVTDWYITAYEPIRDIEGAIVGVLYVGILEKPFRDTIRSRFLLFMAILGAVLTAAAVVSFVLARSISRPLTGVVQAAAGISKGDLSHRVETASKISEISLLAAEFNGMAAILGQREKSLKESNEKLEELNKAYLDLVGMVSHDLKGVLSSVVMNAYTLKDGHLGPLNESQSKSLTSITRSLEYFDAMVKNFLSLSAMEKGEMHLNVFRLNIQEDLLLPSAEAFAMQAKGRGMEILARADPKTAVRGDPSLLLVVLNNLIANAVKYGAPDSKIEVTAIPENGFVNITVANSGTPLAQVEIDRLFIRFSRLHREGETKIRGTGLGLFISKQIVEKHGGSMWCESCEKGNVFSFRIPMENQTKTQS